MRNQQFPVWKIIKNKELRKWAMPVKQRKL